MTMPIKPKIMTFPKPGEAVRVNFSSPDAAQATVKVFINGQERKDYLLDGTADRTVTVESGDVVLRRISRYGEATANDRITVKAVPGEGPNGEGSDSRVFA
jgi:hypothetical protein